MNKGVSLATKNTKVKAPAVVTSKNHIESWLVLPDHHVKAGGGGLDSKAFSAVMNFAGSQKWDGFINLGDFMDYDCISSYNKNSPGHIEGTSLAADHAEGNRILDITDTNVKTKNKIFINGNHDQRLDRYVAANPRLKGTLDQRQALNLPARNYQFVDYANKGEFYRKGSATFIHGTTVVDNHPKTNVIMYGTNVFYGHLHSVSSYSLRTVGDGKTRIGQSLGCLCDYKPYYLKGFPNRWQQAFGVFYFNPNGTFNYYIPMIFSGQFIWNGEEWGGV